MIPPRSLILDTCVGAVFHTALLFSLFLLFAGHNAPGGGFVGGLVAGAAFVLRYVQGGAGNVGAGINPPPHLVLGIGLTVAVVTGAVPFIVGGQFLESAMIETTVPVLGKVKASSALGFDIGVYLVVVGLVLTILRTLGQEADEHEPRESMRS